MIERDDLLKILVFITVTKKNDSMIFEKKTLKNVIIMNLLPTFCFPRQLFHVDGSKIMACYFEKC